MIIKGPNPDVEIPEIPLTDFVLQRAAQLGDKPALIEGPTGRTITYAQLVEAVKNVAGNLYRRGFRKGDVFGILSPNIPEYAIALHAVSSLGGSVTPINPLYTHHEIHHQLKDAGARFLVTVPTCVEKAREGAKETGVEELFVFGSSEGAIPFGSLLEPTQPAPKTEIDPRNDLIVLPYSSGTTGLPKGVMLTHYNLVANVLQSFASLRVREEDTVLGVLPFFHIYGMLVIMNLGLYAGATVVTMPRFDLEQCLQTLQNY